MSLFSYSSIRQVVHGVSSRLMQYGNAREDSAMRTNTVLPGIPIVARDIDIRQDGYRIFQGGTELDACGFYFFEFAREAKLQGGWHWWPPPLEFAPDIKYSIPVSGYFIFKHPGF